MSSRIVPSGGAVEAVQWRRVREAEPAPAAEPSAAERLEDEVARLQAEAGRLAGRLEAAAREAAERETRALEQGRADGLAAGRREGASTARAEAEAEIAAVQAEAAVRATSAAEQAVLLRQRLRLQLEADLVQLAVAIARRILRRELAVDPEALLGIVKSAVEKIAARELLAIRVSPSDGPRVREGLAALRLPDRVEVIEDGALGWGAVAIDTTRGGHDASVETQLEEIDRGLADLARRPS